MGIIKSLSKTGLLFVIFLATILFAYYLGHIFSAYLPIEKIFSIPFEMKYSWFLKFFFDYLVGIFILFVIFLLVSLAADPKKYLAILTKK